MRGASTSVTRCRCSNSSSNEPAPLFPGPAADGLGVAPGRLVARQVVRGVEPGELLSGEDVSRRTDALRFPQRAGQQMDFIRHALVLVGERRAAARAEPPSHAWR